eukprot:scaffold41381_cov70-Phaeocystis_antarctica.AAC.3
MRETSPAARLTMPALTCRAWMKRGSVTSRNLSPRAIAPAPLPAARRARWRARRRSSPTRPGARARPRRRQWPRPRPSTAAPARPSRRKGRRPPPNAPARCRRRRTAPGRYSARSAARDVAARVRTPSQAPRLPCGCWCLGAAGRSPCATPPCRPPARRRPREVRTAQLWPRRATRARPCCSGPRARR